MSANETQVAGSHYRATVQHWDYVLLALGGRYLEGNITKYVTRHRKKNGLQDLEKAAHYLTKLIEEVQAGRIKRPVLQFMDDYVHRFSVENGLNTPEDFVIKRCANWVNVDDLHRIGEHIAELMVNAKRAQVESDARKAGFPAPDEAGAGYVNQG